MVCHYGLCVTHSLTAAEDNVSCDVLLKAEKGASWTADGDGSYTQSDFFKLIISKTMCGKLHERQ